MRENLCSKNLPPEAMREHPLSCKFTPVAMCEYPLHCKFTNGANALVNLTLVILPP